MPYTNDKAKSCKSWPYNADVCWAYESSISTFSPADQSCNENGWHLNAKTIMWLSEGGWPYPKDKRNTSSKTNSSIMSWEVTGTSTRSSCWLEASRVWAASLPRLNRGVCSAWSEETAYRGRRPAGNSCSWRKGQNT